MKLNYKRTFLVGLAFFSICAFWQMYDSVMTLILTNTFSLNETWSGVIMAADNVLALFLLPFFGKLSDQCRSPMGRRAPFILFGTLAAVILMIVLPIISNTYAAAPSTGLFWVFVAVLGLLLVSMGTYRSPAVALMPDVTPKPLRSKGNAVINLMGAAGGILYLIISSVMYPSSTTPKNTHVNYLPLFAIVGGIMVVSVTVLLCTIRERKLEAEIKQYEDAHQEEILTVVDDSGKEVLPPAVKRSLAFLLVSISLWFIGYNAVTTWFTKYAETMWDMALGDASLCLTVATAGAIVSYIPIGALASRIGRRKTILIGVALLATCFATGWIYTITIGKFSYALFALFLVIGFSWAAINVNSLPMVVEMCKGSEVGKFTGYYYTFSMAAQTITPITAGYLLSNVSYQALFPYAALFVAASFVTMLMVRHGDNTVSAKKSVLENFDVED
ncbi:MAG: MFS transporter [Clostridia bacterium]|nr:MFS transporter [Clostridia bacterium]